MGVPNLHSSPDPGGIKNGRTYEGLTTCTRLTARAAIIHKNRSNATPRMCRIEAGSRWSNCIEEEKVIVAFMHEVPTLRNREGWGSLVEGTLQKLINSRCQVWTCYLAADSAAGVEGILRMAHDWRWQKDVQGQGGFRRGCAPVGTTSTLPSAVEKRGHRVPAWPAHESLESSADAAAGLMKGRRRLPPLRSASSAESPGARPWRTLEMPATCQQGGS